MTEINRIKGARYNIAIDAQSVPPNASVTIENLLPHFFCHDSIVFSSIHTHILVLVEKLLVDLRGKINILYVAHNRVFHYRYSTCEILDI